jgi:beta-lactamase class A
MKQIQYKYILLFVILFLVGTIQKTPAQEPHQEILFDKTRQEIEKIAENINGVIGFAMLDLVSGESLLINENLIFPQASSIKIPILIELLKQTTTGVLDISERVEITREKTVGGSGILQFFGDGTSELNWYDLAVLMISLSDNSATNIIIDHVGMNEVNATLRELGFSRTKLQRKMMDSEASARGDENISTPLEAMRIMETLYRRTAVDATVSEQVLEILRVPKSSEFRKSIPQTVPIANKPGSLTGVVTEWALVEVPGRPYVLIFMSNYGFDSELRTAAQKLSDIVYNYFSRLAGTSPHGVGVF